jgi:plasmid stabilization system protein ParE
LLPTTSFQAIYERFEERGEGNGDGLFQDLNSALERVCQFPEIGRTFEPLIRRVLIDQGRYGLFYLAALLGVTASLLEKKGPR